MRMEEVTLNQNNSIRTASSMARSVVYLVEGKLSLAEHDKKLR